MTCTAKKRKKKVHGARKNCPATVHRVMPQRIAGIVVMHDGPRQAEGCWAAGDAQGVSQAATSFHDGCIERRARPGRGSARMS
jgi:hypothetical protein